jgi:hypothetical protein
MKLVIDLSSNTIAGGTDDPAFAPTSQQVLIDAPEDFDMSSASEWSYDGVSVSRDSVAALDRAKAARKVRIKADAARLIDATAWRLERAREQEAAGWATTNSVDAVLAERESIRRSSSAADDAVDAMTDIASVQNYTWSVDVVAEVPNRTEWLMDIGPFFDRFGAAKIATLASSDVVVQAIVKDCQSRKWIDLRRPDVPLALDALVSKLLIDATTKAAILNTPVASDENLALRKLFFAA